MSGVSRSLVLALFLAIVVAGLGRLRFDTDVLSLLPGDLPTVRALVLQQRHFASSSELLITLRGDDPDLVEEGSRALAEHLRTVGGPALARWIVWTSPWEERPDLAAELVALAWLNAPPAEVRNLADRLRPGILRARLEQVRAQLATSLSPAEMAQAGYDPLGLLPAPGMSGWSADQGPRFASDDGRFRMVIVTPPDGLGGYKDTNAWFDRVRALVNQWQAGETDRSRLAIRYTGGPAYAAEISQGMERDMRGSVLGTALVIAVLFYWAHRRLRPLLALIALLALTLVATLGAGGWIFGSLNAVSLGFAAILLGLTVDYGLVLYQEALEHPDSSPGEIRRRVGGGIAWGAVTTAAAFAMLTLGGLPGLTQLGALVACGTAIGALVMLTWFLSPGLIGRLRTHDLRPRWLPDGVALAASGIMAAAALLLLGIRGGPAIDPSAAPLRPRYSEADLAMKELRARLDSESPDPMWIVAHGADAGTVARQLRAADLILRTAQGSGDASRATLPTLFWPDADRHAENRSSLAAIAAAREEFQRALGSAGFSEEAFRMASVILDAWQRAGRMRDAFWPTNEVSAWTLAQFAHRREGMSKDGRFFALGYADPGSRGLSAPLRDQLREAGLLVGSWATLGSELLGRVESRLFWVGGVTLAVWLASLGLAFRTLRDIALAMASMGLGMVLLLAWMSAVGWDWNLMNLMAIPLLLGAGTDYSIHLLLALRRHRGDLRVVHRTTGRAVLLCVATTVAGFASLALSTNEGLASLGAVCAVGLACVYLVSAHAMPAWWRRVHRLSMAETPPSNEVGTSAPADPSATARDPSVLYQAQPWHWATRLARIVPRSVLGPVSALVAMAYAAAVPSRRRIVEANLLPLVGHDPVAARRAAWRNFAAFGRKLADLWAYEAGHRIHNLFVEFTGWEHVEAARAQGRGILLLTPHLGNWEFGAPILASRGLPLLVVTLAEPGSGFTELRQAARARWGTETLVIREDPFAFVTLIQRLQAGDTVALLIDRPPAPSAVPAELFGQPLDVSIAGAELARASGCVLLPTVIVRSGVGYAAHVLAPVSYDRRELGRRPARHALAQDILRAFEPWLRQYPEQWFHFVSVWRAVSPAVRPESGGPGPSEPPASPPSSSSSSPRSG